MKVIVSITLVLYNWKHTQAIALITHQYSWCCMLSHFTLSRTYILTTINCHWNTSSITKLDCHWMIHTKMNRSHRMLSSHAIFVISTIYLTLPTIVENEWNDVYAWWCEGRLSNFVFTTYTLNITTNACLLHSTHSLLTSPHYLDQHHTLMLLT